MSNLIAVVSVSGGKDSQETANRAIDKYGPDRVRIVMADTGNEHPLCMEFVENDLPAMLGVPITILRADFSRQIDPMPDEPDFGECLWAEPVPIWITNAERHDSMMASDGKGCQTWKEKE